MIIDKPIVLVLASMFPRWENDTEARFVYDLCQQLKDDYELLVLTPHCSGAKTQETLEGLKIVRYRYGPERLENLAYEGGILSKLKANRLNWLMVPFFFLGQWLAVVKLLRKYPIKVIHAHWLIPQGMIAVAARAVSKNKPAILCTSHGGDLHGLNDPVSKMIKRKVIRESQALSVVSSPMQDMITQLVPEVKPPVVAPMGTDLQHLFVPDEKIERNPFQLLFVGRLVRSKGLEYLLKALPVVLEKFPQIQLNIAGHGADLAFFKSLVTELDIQACVTFLGALPHPELAQQYQQSSLAIFPFTREGFGLVTVEAMGCECPVIVSDIPAVQDIVSHNQTGLLAQSESSDDFAKQIMILLSSSEQAHALSRNGREHVVSKFGWSVIAERYRSLINSLLST